ncbi:hypothetical protein T01_8591 [Trichinella spiralis]|uniref:Uncharacterized protein n=1 Tax=Trichinella spiralis TaxID=6334 RepID=A0A0V0YRL3_TRISP|nr:hypothetical protein T01_8591 [Trichinella spiralis]
MLFHLPEIVLLTSKHFSDFSWCSLKIFLACKRI